MTCPKSAPSYLTKAMFFSSLSNSIANNFNHADRKCPCPAAQCDPQTSST